MDIIFKYYKLECYYVVFDIVYLLNFIVKYNLMVFIFYFL